MFILATARPDDGSRQDRAKLVDDYGITNILDLRSKAEHIKQAKKQEANIRSSAALPQSNDTAAEPLKISGIQYHEINVNGRKFEHGLIRHLSWTSFSKLVTLMVFGYRMEAIGILGREVMQPRGLIGLGYDSLDNSQDEIRQIFEVLAKPASYPMMINCTQGKDRTGLTVLLVLLLLEVPIEAISHDYLLSENELLPEKETRMEELREIGLGEDFAGTPKDWVIKETAYIEEKYGGIRKYLERIGVDEKMQASVKSALAPMAP
ncbi:MAG: hypothetical protein M1827_003026 [Pycnora praestabilis]|nr:MAG: hypothetical protein M1827_003026 [Pycnora praestabilis]